jgi:hypothetical protein
VALAIVHGRLVPDGKLRESKQSSPQTFLGNGVCRLVAEAINGDLENGVGSTSSDKEQSCNSRGGDTENNAGLAAEVMREGVIDKCLPCAARTAEEKNFAQFLFHGFDNAIECELLFSVHSVEVVSCARSLLGRVIIKLLSNQRIFDSHCPIPLRLRHPKISKEVAGILEIFVEQK